MNIVACPNCGKAVEISEAIRHQIQEEVLKAEQTKHQEEIEKIKHDVEEKTRQKIEEELSHKFKDKEQEAEEARIRNKELQEQLLTLTKQLRELKLKDDARELEMQRKLAENEEKIRQDARKKAEEEQHLLLAGKEKQLQDTLKELEDARRKIQQGSQQTQGEVLELELEELLRREFKNDVVSPVAKGVRGADIIQEVWDSKGNFAGKILWELKNTKTPWKEDWVIKLKNDKREINADDAVLVSGILPKDIENTKYRNGIWVTQRNFVIATACALRAKLIQIYYLKESSKGKNEKVEALYSYLSGVEFKHRVEAMMEAYTLMQTEIEKEKRFFSTKWAREEKNIRRLIDSTSGMRGDLEGIMGESLPEIKEILPLQIQDGQEQ